MIESTLADDVQAMTFATKLFGHTFDPAIKTHLARYRAQLRRAERFIVDDDAVRLCCHLSHEKDRFRGWSFLARLPYSVMWLDLDLHAKVREFDKMKSLEHPFDPMSVSPRIGYLLYHDGNSATRWIAHAFSYMSQAGSVLPCPFSYVFDPEGEGDINGSLTFGSPTLSRRIGPIRTSVTTTDGRFDVETPPESVMCGVFENVEGEIRAPEWFSKRAAVIVDPIWDSLIQNDKLYKILPDQLEEERGAFRYLITLLAAINSIPRDVRPMNVRAGTRTVGMRQLPFLRHNNLTLTVPRDDQVIWMRNHMDRAAAGRRRAWHTVMGHWRVIERGKARGLCRHEPTMVESGVGICQKCELMVRWITLPNGRGDPSVGMVDHAYRLAARKRGKALSAKVSAL